MTADEVAVAFSRMDYGVGMAAYFCYLFSVSTTPKLELTTDGFMLCYGECDGLHVFKFGDSIFCRTVHKEQHRVYVMKDQADASEIYDKVMMRLLAETVAA